MASFSSVESSPQAKSGPPPRAIRYHGLDALRGFAMLLGIVLHAALSYSFGFEYGNRWWPQDDRQSWISRYIFEFIHAWRMPTFFILAGFFAHLALDRRGTKSFVINRMQRIAVPLILFGTAMAATLPTIWQSAVERRFIFVDPLSMPFSDLEIGHLWFLYHLVYLYAILLALRWVAVIFPRTLSLGRLAQRVFVNVWQAPFIVVVAIVLLLLWTVGNEDKGNLAVDPFDLLYSLAPFMFGYGLYNRRELVDALAGTPVLIATLLIATAGFVVKVWLINLYLSGSLGDEDPLGLLLPIGAATAAVCYSLGFIGLFRKLFSRPWAWVRWVADSSYWIYIMHLPVVLLLASSMFTLPWAAELKFLIVCVSTGVLGFATYGAFVRYTWIGTMLNGKRQRA